MYNSEKVTVISIWKYLTSQAIKIILSYFFKGSSVLIMVFLKDGGQTKCHVKADIKETRINSYCMQFRCQLKRAIPDDLIIYLDLGLCSVCGRTNQRHNHKTQQLFWPHWRTFCTLSFIIAIVYWYTAVRCHMALVSDLTLILHFLTTFTSLVKR